MRALPYAQEANVIRRPNTMLLGDPIPCSIWPTRTRTAASGLTWDHEGETPLEWADTLALSNVVLVVDTVQYAVVEVQRNEFLPHAALRLRRSAPSGA